MRYRIALALSTALLIHTLILAGISFPEPPQQEQQHRLTFKLVSAGSIPTSTRAPARPSAGTATPETARRHPRFEVSEPAHPTAPNSVTKAEAPRPAQGESEKPDSPSPAKRRSEQPAVEVSSPSITTTAGEPARETKTQQETAVSQITQSPSERDPFLIKLATHLARELENLRVPALGELTETTRMEIELRLLSNGALTRARVIRSTGIRRIDEAAYQAALAASPYPEPPAESNKQGRFEIELVFSPKRL